MANQPMPANQPILIDNESTQVSPWWRARAMYRATRVRADAP